MPATALGCVKLRNSYQEVVKPKYIGFQNFFLLIQGCMCQYPNDLNIYWWGVIWYQYDHTRRSSDGTDKEETQRSSLVYIWY